jgi:DNA-binding response OmpR family regulator
VGDLTVNILIVEDDAAIARGLCGALATEGYSVSAVSTASEAMEYARREHPGLVMLDLGLPDGDGVDLCRRLRGEDAEVRIIMVTARQDEIDIVVGLDAGADDYVTKPFRLAELFARVRALLRRDDGEPPTGTAQRFDVGGVTVDIESRCVFVDGVEVELRPREFDLLALLVSEHGRVVKRERIMERVWDEHWFGSTKTLDVHISELRKKLEGASGRITTLRNVGYRFDS